MDKREDDEITLDLSKIKKFFKSEKKSKHKEEAVSEPSEESKSDDEVSIDFSKIKGFFKKDKKKHVEEKSDEVSFDMGDLKKVLGFLNKYKIIFLIMIALFLGSHFRMYPAHLPVTDTWAKDSVYNYYKNQIRTQVNQQYPHLPDENKNKLVDDEFNNLLKEQSDVIEQQVQQTSQQFKSEFQDENGQTYLLAIDPYFWLRFVENLEKNGHIGDKLVDGKPYDDHFLAPIGRFIPDDDFHIYFEYYLYKILSFFDGDMYPLKAAFLAPVILSALCVIPAFFITRRIAGNVGGFFAAVMVAIHPAFLTRTVGGFSDTDAYNVFFPLFIAWLFLEAFETRNTKLTILFSICSGLLMGIYSNTWGGWWYIMDFLLAMAGVYLIYNIVTNRDALKSARSRAVIKDVLILIVVFLISSAIFVTLFTNFTSFMRIFTGPTIFIYLKEVGGSALNIWPNVYTTVAEQNALSFKGVISQIGGNLLFALACFGVVLTLLKKDKQGRIDIRYGVLLVVWFASTMFASTKGVRFVLLLVPAFSIAFGVFVGMVTKYASNFISKELKINKNIAVIAIIIVLALLLVAPYNRAKGTARSEVPSMNDAWVRSLTLIKTNSSENTIINSWWDFGHWFKYWSDRPVTFDGTSQVGDRAHFIGRVLLTDNEDEAIGILRMLDCGGDNAFKTINNKTKGLNDSLESIKLLKEIVMLDRYAAKMLLLSHVDEETAQDVLQYTHCEPPEDYFITSEDMVSKSGVWGHFGSWNFTRADMVWRVKTKKMSEGIKILQQRYGLSTEMADQYYYEITTQDVNNWIAPWPSYASGLSGCSQTNDLVSCGNGIGFDIKTEEAYVNTPDGKLYPYSVSFIDKNGRFKEVKFTKDLLTEKGGGEFSVSIIQDGGGWFSVLMAPELASSMFTRLFYFKGHGLDNFKLFHFDRDVTGLDIIVWKVDWQA